MFWLLVAQRLRGILAGQYVLFASIELDMFT